MFAVIDEAVADSCTGWKCGQVARTHTVQVSVDPCVDFSFEHVNELFLVLFSVGPLFAQSLGRPIGHENAGRLRSFMQDKHE